MAFIDSLLRKRRLTLAERSRVLGVAIAEHEAAERSLATARALYEQAREYLWKQLCDEAELSVQRLVTGRFEESRCHERRRQAETRREECEQRVATQRQAVARLQKTIEKLEERRDEKRRARLAEHTKGEWQRLDEWVTNLHGRSA